MYDMIPFALMKKMYFYMCTYEQKMYSGTHKEPSTTVVLRKGTQWRPEERGFFLNFLYLSDVLHNKQVLLS